VRKSTASPARSGGVSTSVLANVAEGCGRDTILEVRKALRFAMGSASELDYQLLLSHDLGYLSPETFEDLSAAAVEEKRMLASFIATVNRRANGTDH
jgi:four helix bundle protein